MKTYSEREKGCEDAFQSGGPYWHAYTSGKDTPLLFVNDSDFKFAMNAVAQAASMYPKITILAFEIMGNHFHFVIAAEQDDIDIFWRYLSKKLSRRYRNLKLTSLSIKRIDNLNSLRNNIVYTNRNGYVADSSYTPFSYPWGTGRYYFLDFPSGTSLSQITIDNRRLLFKCRTPELPLEWITINDFVAPYSYCAINLGMSMFRDAHHYFNMVSKNVESYSGIAIELDDGEFLTDNELYSQLCKLLRTTYGVTSPKELTKQQKYDIAKKLHFDFRSSNGQIRRVLGITQYEIDTLFPLNKH